MSLGWYPNNHSVDRVLGFFSSRRSWDSLPPPHPQANVYPHPLCFVEGQAYRRGRGGPNSDEGTDTVVLSVYMYVLDAHNTSHYPLMQRQWLPTN